jgi:Transmembrane protein 231
MHLQCSPLFFWPKAKASLTTQKETGLVFSTQRHVKGGLTTKKTQIIMCLIGRNSCTDNDRKMLRFFCRHPSWLLLSIFQMMKWAWVQYVSVLIVFIAIFRQIKIFVFRKQILPTFMDLSSSEIALIKSKPL